MFLFKKDIDDLEAILKKLEKEVLSQKQKKLYVKNGNEILKRLRAITLDVKIEELSLKLYIYENNLFLEGLKTPEKKGKKRKNSQNNAFDIFNELVKNNTKEAVKTRFFLCFC
jgi:hypothetical protein